MLLSQASGLSIRKNGTTLIKTESWSQMPMLRIDEDTAILTLKECRMDSILMLFHLERRLQSDKTLSE